MRRHFSSQVLGSMILRYSATINSSPCGDNFDLGAPCVLFYTAPVLLERVLNNSTLFDSSHLAVAAEPLRNGTNQWWEGILAPPLLFDIIRAIQMTDLLYF